MLFCAFCVLKQQLKALLLSFDFFSNNTIEKFCCGVSALTKRRIENCPISDLVSKTHFRALKHFAGSFITQASTIAILLLHDF